MANKKNFVLRISAETYAALEKWAADEFRSVNGQVEWLIDQALAKAGRKKKGDPTSMPGEEKTAPGPDPDQPGS